MTRNWSRIDWSARIEVVRQGIAALERMRPEPAFAHQERMVLEAADVEVVRKLVCELYVYRSDLVRRQADSDRKSEQAKARRRNG
jgi:hypothetical protein